MATETSTGSRPQSSVAIRLAATIYPDAVADGCTTRRGLTSDVGDRLDSMIDSSVATDPHRLVDADRLLSSTGYRLTSR